MRGIACDTFVGNFTSDFTSHGREVLAFLCGLVQVMLIRALGTFIGIDCSDEAIGRILTKIAFQIRRKISKGFAGETSIGG